VPLSTTWPPAGASFWVGDGPPVGDRSGVGDGFGVEAARSAPRAARVDAVERSGTGEPDAAAVDGVVVDGVVVGGVAVDAARGVVDVPAVSSNAMAVPPASTPASRTTANHGASRRRYGRGLRWRAAMTSPDELTT